MAGGRSPAEPVAFVSQRDPAGADACWKRRWATASPMPPPAAWSRRRCVVVGEVVRLRAGLDWLGALTAAA